MPKYGRLNCYSNPGYLLVITKALHGTKELEWLKKSQFGKLFQLPVSMCGMSGKLVHNMLCRSLLTRRKYEHWFVFGGIPIRYSLREFALLTGLNCGKEPRKEKPKPVTSTTPKKDSYWKTLLGNKSEYPISEIAAMLEHDYNGVLIGAERMPVERRLRLSLVLLVDGILMNDSSIIRASVDVVEMVEDIEAFVNYPWGRKSFELTLKTVKLGHKVGSVKALMAKLSQSHIALHGFTLAYQLLALNCIPKIQELLPSSTSAGFFDHKTLALKTAHKIHNSTICAAENDPELVVHPFLPGGFAIEGMDTSWDDEVSDVNVDYMLSLLSGGHKFTMEEWQTVDENKTLTDDIVRSVMTNVAGVQDVWRRMRRCKAAEKDTKKGKSQKKKADKNKADISDLLASVGGIYDTAFVDELMNVLHEREAKAISDVEAEFETARNNLDQHRVLAGAHITAHFTSARNEIMSLVMGKMSKQKDDEAAISSNPAGECSKKGDAIVEVKQQ